jgi:hypothetical protein
MRAVESYPSTRVRFIKECWLIVKQLWWAAVIAFASVVVGFFQKFGLIQSFKLPASALYWAVIISLCVWLWVMIDGGYRAREKAREKIEVEMNTRTSKLDGIITGLNNRIATLEAEPPQIEVKILRFTAKIINGTKRVINGLKIFDWDIIAEISVKLISPREITISAYKLRFYDLANPLETCTIGDLAEWKYTQELSSPEGIALRIRTLNPPPFQLIRRDLPESGWLHFRLQNLSLDDIADGNFQFEVVTPHGTKACIASGREADQELAFDYIIKPR